MRVSSIMRWRSGETASDDAACTAWPDCASAKGCAPAALACAVASMLSWRPTTCSVSSRTRPSVWSRTRRAQMSLSLKGAFCPTILPLFKGS